MFVHGMAGGVLAPGLLHQLGIEGLFLGGGVAFDVLEKLRPGLAAGVAVAFGIGDGVQQFAVAFVIFLDGIVDGGHLAFLHVWSLCLNSA